MIDGYYFVWTRTAVPLAFPVLISNISSYFVVLLEVLLSSVGNIAAESDLEISVANVKEAFFLDWFLSMIGEMVVFFYLDFLFVLVVYKGWQNQQVC